MPFHSRQKLQFFGSTPQFNRSSTLDESSGLFVESDRNICEALPSPENFELKNLLSAGVPLDKVNTTIVRQSSVNLADIVDKPSDSSQPSNPESISNPTPNN